MFVVNFAHIFLKFRLCIQHPYNSTDCNPDTMLVNTCFAISPYDVEDGADIFGIDALQYSCVPGSTLPIPEGEWVLLRYVKYFVLAT